MYDRVMRYFAAGGRQSLIVLFHVLPQLPFSGKYTEVLSIECRRYADEDVKFRCIHGHQMVL